MLDARTRQATCTVLMATMFIACADAPVATSPRLQKKTQQGLRSEPPSELREGTEFDVLVTSHITILEKGTPKKTFKHRKTVHAKVRNGKAFAVDRGGFGRQSAILALQDEIIGEDGTITNPALNFMPLLAVTDGQLSSQYDHTAADDSGNVVHLVGSAAEPGTPVNDVSVSLNGVHQMRVQMTWSWISGGHVMLDQTQVATLASGGEAIIYSIADQSTFQITAHPDRGGVFLARVGDGLKTIGCLFAPPVAYAATTATTVAGAYRSAAVVGCLYEIGMFIVATLALGIGSATAITTGVGILAYLLAWTSWTGALYDMLDCLS